MTGPTRGGPSQARGEMRTDLADSFIHAVCNRVGMVVEAYVVCTTCAHPSQLHRGRGLI